MISTRATSETDLIQQSSLQVRVILSNILHVSDQKLQAKFLAEWAPKVDTRQLDAENERLNYFASVKYRKDELLY